MAVKVKIKMTGADAKKAAAQTAEGIKDSSGANYVSRNDLHVGASKANPQEGVKPVSNHELKSGSPEHVRRMNNRSRDMRTNLGKSRPMVPVAE